MIIILQHTRVLVFVGKHLQEHTPPRRSARRRGHQRLHQPERPAHRPRLPRLRGIDRGQNPRPRRKREQQKGEGGKLHHPLRPLVYPRRRHQIGRAHV